MLSNLLFALSLVVLGDTAAKPPEFLTIVKVKTASMIQGKIGKAVIYAKTNPPFHIQANPASAPNLIATQLIIDKTDGLEPKEPLYPEPKTFRLEKSTTDLAVYEGEFEITLPVQSTSLMKPNKYELSGKLKFQACDEKKCFFPASLPVVIPVMVYK